MCSSLVNSLLAAHQVHKTLWRTADNGAGGADSDMVDADLVVKALVQPLDVVVTVPLLLSVQVRRSIRMLPNRFLD